MTVPLAAPPLAMENTIPFHGKYQFGRGKDHLAMENTSRGEGGEREGGEAEGAGGGATREGRNSLTLD